MEAMEALITLRPRPRRISPPDVFLAAAAAERGFDVLHYDAHFEILSRVLPFNDYWIVPRGTAD